MDRNDRNSNGVEHLSRSLSARRAWIEIGGADANAWWNNVALRKESVDRNKMIYSTRMELTESLSARRAWIEIYRSQFLNFAMWRRSPQGERG